METGDGRGWEQEKGWGAEEIHSKAIEEAGAKVQSYLSQVDRYAAEMERIKVQCELEKHWAPIDLLREEHAGQLKFLQTQTERERERTAGFLS